MRKIVEKIYHEMEVLKITRLPPKARLYTTSLQLFTEIDQIPKPEYSELPYSTAHSPTRTNTAPENISEQFSVNLLAINLREVVLLNE